MVVPDAMVAGGAALARDDGGRVVFVEGALPGERVRVRVGRARPDYAQASVVEVLERSPERVEPPCPARRAGCGGCGWLHVRPGAQRRYRADIVIDALRRIARIDDPPVPSLREVTEPALRTTARLGVSASGRAGHNRPAPTSGRRRPPGPAPVRATTVVPTESCLAAHPLLEELVVHGRYPGSDEVVLRAGVASGERLVWARRSSRPAAVQVPAGVAVVEPGGTRQAVVHEEVAGRRFRIGAESFFQPGPVAAAALVAAVGGAAGDALAGGGHLVDLYAGVGLFASVLGARCSARVTAVERHSPAVADARANLADLDARVVETEVARWRLDAGDGPPDLVVADPARPGLGRPGVSAVGASATPRLVLVSCDPASLARDTRLLAEAGYRLATVELVDAFPHTPHVETVSRFDRQ